MAGIRCVDITKRFGGFLALERVALAVGNREFVVLLGPSGCGKTTLLRIIAGLERQDAGEVWIGERRVDGLAPRARGIAMVFQNYAVFPHMTVFENIAFGLRMRRVPDEEVRRTVAWAAELLHIESQLDKYTGQLSGGQRQRVAVARALAVRPEVLLMDEPLSNLDALLRLEMRAELKRILAESRTTTLYVTHDQVEAMSLADRIAVMEQGRIVQYDTPLEIYRNPATVFVGSFIGSPPMNFLEAVREAPGRYRVDRLVLAGPAEAPARLLCGIRPEDLAPTEAAAALVGRVVVVEPLGSHQLVSVEGEGFRLRAALASDRPIRPGETLRLAPRHDRVRWFDPESGQRLTP